MASYTALMNIQVDSQQAQLGINNLNKNLTYLSRSSRLTNKSLLQMQQTFLRIENTINQATGNTASFNAKMQQAMNVIKKLRGEVSSLRSQINSLNKATGSAGTSATKATTAFQRFTKTLQQNQYFTSLAVSALAGFVSQRLVGGIIRITDEYTLMENKIKTVTPTVDGVARSMESVYRVAQETRQPLAIVANLYSRIGRNSKELQQNLSALVDITSTVSKAFQLGGATIEESRNAMVQFSQALASGRLQGDELRSILELAPVLAENISKSIGITTGSLRRLASEGLITTEVLIKALLEAGKDIRTQFANFTPTVSQSAETVVNAFTRLIGSNQKFKDANEVLGNQLRKFSSALDEQGALANKLGDAYLFVARNVDILAAAFAGLAVIVGGAAIAGLFAFVAALPKLAAAGIGLTALAAAIGGYTLSASSAEEETSKLVEGTENLLKILSDTDMKTLSEKNVTDIQADIMGKQAGIQRLISETSLALKEINEDLKETEQYTLVEKILGSSPELLFPGASLVYKDEAALKQEKALKEERLEMLRDLAKQLGIEYDNIAEAQQEGALKAILARTKALEMQKRLLKEQERDEQISYFGSFGSGASEKQLKDIQFANKAAQDLRKRLSDLQMSTLDTAFVGKLSVKTLFGGTDPAAAVENLKSKITEFIQITETDPAGGIVKFFTKYMGEEGKKQIEEISTKLKEQPLLAKGIKEGMVTVWQEALANYEIYKSERDAGENRFIEMKKRDLKFEAKEQQALFDVEKRHLDYLLDESATIHDADVRAVTKQTNLRYQQILIELESKEISADRAKELTSELRTLHEINTALAQQALRAKAVNQILQNREEIRVGQSTQNVTAETGGFEEYGGSQGYNMIGSALRDIDIKYKVQLATIEAIYGVSSKESIELRTQEGTLRNQNIQREIGLKLEKDLLNIERIKEDIAETKLESDMKESGASDLEVQLKLIERRTDLELISYDTLFKTGKINSDQYTQLRNMTIEKGKYNKKLLEEIKAAEDLKATYAERAVGQAVIDGAQDLFSGEFYSKIYDSLVSGSNYLLEGFNKIEWSDLGTQIGDGLKNIDWDNLGDLFKGGMGDLAGSGLFQGIASAAGPSGQRALSIAQAGAAGGPIAALGAAILSNEKVQQALSKLFDTIFEFIDPFLDLLGPVVDIFTAMVKNNPIMNAVNALKPFLESLGNAISGLARAVASLDLGSQGGTIGYIFGGGLASDIEGGFNKLANLVGLGYQSGQRDFIAGDTVIDYQKSVLDPIFEDIDYVFEHGFRRFSSDPSVRGLIDQNFDQFSLTAEAAESFLKEVDRIGFDEALEGSLSLVSEAFDQIVNLYIHGYDKDKVSRNAAAVKEELTRLLEETYFRGLLAEFIEGVDSEIKSINDNIKSKDFFDFHVILNDLRQEVEDLALPGGMFDEAIEKINEFSEAFKNYSNILAEEQIQEISLRGYDLTNEQEIELKYYDEMLEVRRNTNLTLADQKIIIDALTEAREREVAAMEREQELLNLQGAQNTLAEILSTFEKTVEGINDLITSLYDQVQDLLFGEFNLDPYLQKFELASDTYGALLASAFDPDATEEDIEKLQQFVNTYLGTARDLYKSSSTFQQIFSNVLSDLSLLGVQAGFNMPQAAVSGATSEIQDFIDATEDLTEDLSETLNDLIFELNGLGLAFANQKIDIIQDEIGIPLKITNDIITVDLSSVSLPLELNNDNFSLSTTKLNFAEAFGEITFDPDFGQITDNSGWQQYEKTATFSATITGWDYFTGEARYSATATFTGDFGAITETTGWQGYTRTASFSAILLNFKEYDATASLDTNVDTEQEKINAGFKEYSANATFSTNVGDAVAINLYASLDPEFDGLGETKDDPKGFHIGYADLDLITTSIGLSLSDKEGLINGYSSLDIKFKDIGKTLSDSEGLINGYVSLSLSGISQNSSSPTLKYGYVLYSQSAKFDYNNQRLDMSTNSSYPSILSGYVLFAMNSGWSSAESGWSSSSGNPHPIYGWSRFFLNNGLSDLDQGFRETTSNSPDYLNSYGWARFLLNNGLSDSNQGFKETTSNSPDYLNSYGWARFLFNNGISQASQGFKLTTTDAASWHTLYGWTYFVLNSGHSSSSIGFNTTTSTTPNWQTRYGWSKFLFNNGWSEDSIGFRTTTSTSPDWYARYGWTKFLFNNGWSIDYQGFSTDEDSPKEYEGYATFDSSPFVSEFEKARDMIQSTIDSFSLNLLPLLETLSIGGAYVSEAQITSLEDSYYSGAGYGTTYAQIQKTSWDDEPVASIQDLAATLKTSSPEATGYDYGVYYVIKSREYDPYTSKVRDRTLPRLTLFSEKSDAEAVYNNIAGFPSSSYIDFQNLTKLGFQKGGLVPGIMDTIPAMLSPGEYIMSRGAVESLGIGTLNSLNAGDLSALRQTGDPEVRRLLRELIVAVQTSDTEVNVYTDTKGETKAAINEFRTELRERSRRQGEKYVNVRYV